MTTLSSNKIYITDGGLETVLIFEEGLELPHFAAFELINTIEGRNTLKRYFEPYIALAEKYNTAFILGTPTWRANPDWGYLLGYSLKELDNINQQSVAFLQEIRKERNSVEMLVSGCVGPRADGYVVEKMMSRDEAAEYHRVQLTSLVEAGVDVISAMTLNYTEEAIGIALAAWELKVPLVISFTLETDGRLPGGETLADAINIVDAATDSYVSYYMINCAHPDHFKETFIGSGEWVSRMKGIRPNASTKSHAELNESVTLDRGDVQRLATECKGLVNLLPELMVIGGCCGTDHHHISAICERLLAEPVKA